MQRNAKRVIVAIVLLTCFVCPLLELFDHWDDTIQTGNDTEYTVVVLALCIGIIFTLVQLTVALLSNLPVSNASSRLQSLENTSFLLIAPAALASISGGPPLNLRI